MIWLADKETIIADPPVKIKPAVDTDVLASVQPGSLEDGYVYIHCHCRNKGDELLIRIWLSTFLVDAAGGTQSPLIHAENISIAPQWTMVPRGATYNFLLVFGSLPPSCRKFDLIEKIAQPGGFVVKNIPRNESDVYHIDLL